MKIVCISDTNGDHSGLEDLQGDILVHCGDFTKSGTQKQVTLKFKHKVVIAGHKQYTFDIQMYQSKLKKTFHTGFPDYDGQTYKSQLLTMENVYYLQHQSIQIQGISIFGSPYQPLFQDLAFGRQVNELQQKWKQVNQKIDILVTHCAPFGILDKFKNTNTGCKSVLQKVKQLEPRYHIFGHCRQQYGQKTIGKTKFINCCRFNDKFKPVNAPVVIQY